MTDARRIPLTCRLGIRHDWRVVSTSDGNRFKACAKCGKDKPITNIDVQFFH
jgi:hypothetical protein